MWVRYYDCSTGSPLDTYYDMADNYYHVICNNNVYGTPYLYNHIEDNAEVVASSTIIDSGDSCSIEPTYYYYSLGDCYNMRYSYTAITVTGFGAPIIIPGCATEGQLTDLIVAGFGNTSYNVDYNDPCGFGTGFTGSYIGRSLTQLTEGDVYTYSGACYSIVELNPLYVTSYDLEMSSLGSPVTGFNPCSACDPPFSGYTIVAYSGTTCDTEENIMVYTILGGLTLGQVFGVQLYSGTTVMADPICATLTDSLGPQFVLTNPDDGIYGYVVADAGQLILGGPAFPGYADCGTCNARPKKYNITGERCDNPSYSTSVWSTTLPTLQIGDTFQNDDTYLSSYCWSVTKVDHFKTVVPYYDLNLGILDTGCDCNGNNGGGNVNVDNIVASATQSLNTGSECQSPMGQYYSETTITEMELTFRDSSNNPVIPNDTVQYRVNGGSLQTLSVTGTTVTFSVSLVYGDNSNCSGGSGSYADTLDVKVGTITILTYTAGSS